MEEGLAPRVIALAGLLLAQGIDVRVAPRREGPLGADERFSARGSVARGPRPSDKEPTELVLAPGVVKGVPFHGAHTHANADRIQVVDHRLPEHKEGWYGYQFPGVEAIWIASLGQQLLRFFGIVRHGLGG